MAELGVQPPTGLYPQPPAPPSQGALSDPTKMLDLFGSVMRNQVLQNELKGRAAVGQAYQGALQPDGSFDPNRLSAGLKNPDAAWMLPEIFTNFLNQQGIQSDIATRQDATVRAIAGTLPPNATDEQIRHYGATLARAKVPPEIIAGHLNDLLSLKGRKRAEAITNLQTSAIGPTGIAGQIPGPPTAAGAETRRSLGTTLREQAQTGGTAIGQPPGEAESQAAAAAGAASLEATGPKTAQIHADLENLRQLNKDIPLQGPTAEFEKKLNQVGARLGIGVTMTAQQLAKAEEFDKIANQLSLNQSTLFHGSDATGRTIVAANPNLGMSRYGREGVIDMLQGNQDAVDRARGVWLAARRAGAPASSFNQFVDRISKDIDPRVFQFNRISKENQQKFLDDMDQAELPEFERKYKDAISKGWVKPLKGGKTSQAEPPVPGARQAADGHWYVRQPHANGDYQRVIMNA